MQVLEDHPQRLTLRHRSYLFGGMFAVGAVLWVVLVVGTTVRGAVTLTGRNPLPPLYDLQMFALGIFFILGTFGAWVGAQTALQILGGTTCTFDRITETVTVTKPGWFRTLRQQHSIYGVSHTFIERNDEVETYALYLVLRSGERILLGVYQAFEQANLNQTTGAIKTFLASR